jgi:hypothetical protein
MSVLKKATQELAGQDQIVRRHAEAVSDQLGAKPLARFSPISTAALVATLARARLLPDRAEIFADAQELTIDPRIIATLVLQCRLLTHGSLLTDMRVHPYALYQVRRSLWFLAASFGNDGEYEPRLEEAVHNALQSVRTHAVSLTELLLARSRLQGVRDGEMVALVFCAALLALQQPDPAYVIEALKAATKAQSPRGDWQQGRRIAGHINPDTAQDQLFVSTHEVAVAFAEAIMWLGQVPGANTRLAPRTMSALQTAMTHLRESRVEFPAEARPPARTSHPTLPMVGWSSTHVYGNNRIDTRATASAIRFTVATRAISEQARSVRALDQFDEVWDPAFEHTPGYLEWWRYVEESEPDSANAILPYLDKHFVKIVKDRKLDDRRPWARTQGMSAILFGPPGTTKTTIVKSMAQGLKWPLVTLSPGTFIRDGLENVEKRAIEVFSHLRDLVRVVVLFDECDELFRKRRGANSASKDAQAVSDEARSISAFMTASMLPKLQGLRDNGQIFFVIATNYFEEIDPAAKRIGRIDRVVGVGWPDEKQRDRIIRETLKRILRKDELEERVAEEAICALAKRTRFYVRGELAERAGELAGRLRDETSDDGRRLVDQMLKEVGEKPSMPDDDREAFVESAVERSACHQANRGEMRKEV